MATRPLRRALSMAALMLVFPAANAITASYFVVAGTAVSLDDRTSIEKSVSRPMSSFSGAADLAAARVDVSASYFDEVGGSAVGSARFGETLTILGVTEPTTVTLTMHITGSSFAAVSGLAQLAWGNGGFECTSLNCGFVGSTLGGRAWPWFYSSGQHELDRTLSLPLTVSPDDATFSLMALVSTSVTYGSGLYSVRLSLDVPDGLGFSSASGVFLVPVSEPSTFVLVGAGLVAGAAWRRARRPVRAGA